MIAGAHAANRVAAGRDLARAAIFPHRQAVTLYAAGAASALLAVAVYDVLGQAGRAFAPAAARLAPD